jgi:hypothetical protein
LAFLFKNHLQDRHEPLAFLFKNHLQDRSCTYSTISSTTTTLLLKIQSFLIFETTHITEFHTKISHALVTFSLAHPTNIAMEVSMFGGEIKIGPNQFITAYQTFETHGQ